MTTKFYLHAAATSDTGTLPGSTSGSATTPTVTATGASTNASMDFTLGTAQADATLNSSATKTSQTNWLARCLSAPIAAQTISGTATIGAAVATANASNSSWLIVACVYIWRPSTGALVGRLADVSTVGWIGAAAGTTTELWVNPGGGATLSSVTAADGDIIVAEIFGQVTQAKATSYRWDLWYDGTTEGSSSSAGSFIDFSQTINMFTPSTANPPPIRSVNQAVNRAAVY